MTERTEYHELLLHLLKGLQREVSEIKSVISALPSSDAVDALRADLTRLQAELEALSNVVGEERRSGVEVKTQLKIAGAIAFLLLSLLGGALFSDIKISFGGEPAAEAE